MDSNVIENDPVEVKKYMANFVPINNYRALGDEYLYQVRATLLHSGSGSNLFSARYEGMFNDIQVAVGNNSARISTQQEVWADLFSAGARRTDILEAHAANANASIAEIREVTASTNAAQAKINTKLQASFDDIIVGGRNLIVNSTFAKGYDTWSESVITPTDHYIGKMHRIAPTGDIGSTYGIMPLDKFKRIRMVQGTQYSLSFYGFGSVLLLDQVYLVSAEGDLTKLPNITMSTDLTERRHITFTAPISGSGIGFIIGATSGSTEDWFSIAQLKLELGTKPTDWSPAPEDIDGYISQVQSSIDEFKEVQITRNEATATVIQALDSRIGDNTSSILSERKTNASRYATLTQTTDRLSGATGDNKARIEEVNTVITNKYEIIASKVTTLEADSVLGKGKIENLETVTSNNKEVIATTSKNLSAKIDGIGIGGRNLLRNANFKLGLKLWGTAASTETKNILGNLVTITNVGTDTDYFGFGPLDRYKTISLAAGREYVLSFYAEGSIPFLNDIWISSQTGGAMKLPDVALTTSLGNRAELVFVSEFTASDCTILLGANSSATNEWFGIVAVKLEQGNKATDWTEAPEDTRQAIDSVEANINEFKQVQVTNNQATTSSINTMQSNIGNNSAKITENYNTLVSSDEAITRLYTNLSAEYGLNKAQVSNSIQAVTNNLSTTIQVIDSFKAEFDSNKTGVDSSINSLVTENTAQTKRMDNLYTSIGESNAAITNEAQVRSNKDEAIVTSVNQLSTRTDNAEGRISKAELAISTNTGAMVQQKTELTAAYKKAIISNDIKGRNYLSYNFNSYILDGYAGFLFRHIEGDMILSIHEKDTSINLGYCFVYLSPTVNPNSSPSITYKALIELGEKKLIGNTTPVEANQKYLSIYPPTKEGVNLFFKKYDIKIERGDKATGWTVAPEDVEADYNAKISTEATARATADNAITSSVTTLKSDYDTNKASVTSSLSTLTSKDTALTNSLNALTTDYNGNKTTVSNSLTALSTADTALGNRITATDAIAKNAQSRVGTAETAISNANSAIANQKTEVEAKFNNLANKNLIDNGTFTVGQSRNPWSIEASTIVVGEASYDGTLNAIRLGVNQSNSYILASGLFKELGFHTLSFWIKGNKAGQLNVSLAVQGVNNYIPVTTAWTKHTLSANVTSLAGYSIVFGGWASWTDLSLEVSLSNIELTKDSASVNDVAASVTAEATARSNADEALGNRITATDATAKNAQARVGTVETAVATNTSAIAQTSTKISAAIENIEVGGRNLLANSNDIVFNSSDYGNGNLTVTHSQGYKSITARYDGNVYGYAYNTTEMSAGQYTFSIEVWSTFDTSMYFRIGGVFDGQFFLPSTGGAWKRYDFIYNGDSRQSNTSFLLGFINLVIGQPFYFRGMQIIKGNKATSWNPAPEDIKNDVAAIQIEATATANALGTMASSVTNLTSTVNGHTSSINETRQSLNGLSASWSMETNINGKVSGIYQHSTGKRSGLDIITDRFSISDGTTSINPFVIEGGVIRVGVPLVSNSVITSPIINGGTVMAGTFQGGQIAIGDVTATNNGVITTGNFRVLSDGTLYAKAGVFEGTVLADKISGTIDIASMKKSAWMGGYTVYYSKIHTYTQTSQFNKTYSTLKPSKGSIDVFYAGDGYYYTASMLFELDLIVRTATVVKLMAHVVDDFVDVLVNGRHIAVINNQHILVYNNNFPENQNPGEYTGYNKDTTPLTLNLPSGNVKIQFLVRNSGGNLAFILVGDFIDNDNIKYA